MSKIDYEQRSLDLANDNIKLMDKNRLLNSENKELKEQLILCGVGNSNDKKDIEFDEWLKKQKLTEVVTKEYKWREFVLDEDFVLAKYNQDKQS